jgi:hemolysin III
VPPPIAHSEKPRYRGYSHQLAFFAFLVATVALMFFVRSATARIAVSVYGASVCLLYGISALYHRGRWSEAAARRIQRLDHSAIFVLIAGSYTPLFLLLAPADSAIHPALMVWLVASVGVLKALIWPHSPGWITTALAIAVGWCGVSHVTALSSAMGAPALTLIVAAGITYTIGGVVYALRRPDPLPKIFGYHEVFHALVVTAGVTHFAHVVLVLQAAGAFTG